MTTFIISWNYCVKPRGISFCFAFLIYYVGKFFIQTRNWITIPKCIKLWDTVIIMNTDTSERVAWFLFSLLICIIIHILYISVYILWDFIISVVDSNTQYHGYNNANSFYTRGWSLALRTTLFLPLSICQKQPYEFHVSFIKKGNMSHTIVKRFNLYYLKIIQ